MSKPDIKHFLKRTQAAISKHSPEILTGVGIAGMITTTVLAVKETPKALRLIEDKKREEDVDKLTAAEVVKTCWKCYIPAAVTGAASVTCLIGACKVSAKRTAALTAAYKLSETALAEYREATTETVGEKKEQLIRDRVNQKQIEKRPIEKARIESTGKGDSLFLDPLSGRYFRCSIDCVRRAEIKLNKQIQQGSYGTASLNDFYEEIGLGYTDTGYLMGWNTCHLVDLDITPGITPDEEPCLVIGHYNKPKYDY
jgi:hypothetical protein